MGLNGGTLDAGYDLDIPAGPADLTSQVRLAYSSAGVSEQHNPNGAASWVGEGWSLGMGSISWAEHQVFSTCGSCTPQWEDSWQLSDPFGTAADLVPPNINVSTYLDDSGDGVTPSPVTWQTSPEARAKVISFTGPNPIPGGTAGNPSTRDGGPGSPCRPPDRRPAPRAPVKAAGATIGAHANAMPRPPAGRNARAGLAWPSPGGGEGQGPCAGAQRQGRRSGRCRRR